MSAQARPETPYVGLMPYAEGDAPFFFGRERERTLIIANLMASRLTLLYGPSGVGKSSVLNAGVMPHLHRLVEQDRARGGAVRFAVTLYNSWSDDHVAGLLKAAHSSVAAASGVGSVEPPAPGASLTDALDALTRTAPDKPSARLGLLIILDQFEEFFLYPRRGGERSLAEELPRLLGRTDLDVNILLSLREDHLASLDRFKGRIPNLFDNTLRVEHLRRAAAHDAIFKPVEEYNRRGGDGAARVEVEPQLAEAVLDQVKINEVILGEAGRGVVELAAGHAAAADHIETSYLQLVMTRLWQQEMAVGSRRLRLTSLNELGGAKSIVRTHVDAIMRKLSPEEREISSRIFNYLVTPSGTKIAYLPSDLATLTGIDEDVLVRLLDNLSSSGVRILTTIDPPPDRPDSPRYEIRHDALAPAILNWRFQYVRKQEWAENALKLESARKRVMRLRLVLGGVAVLFCLMTVLSGFAYYYYQQASKQGRVALSRELAAYSVAADDHELGILLAKEAVESHHTDQADDALRKSLLRPDLRAVLKGHTNWVNLAEFSPDSRRVLTASGDGTARVWDVATGKTLVELKGHRRGLFGAAFSPDGTLIASAGADGVSLVWEAATGKVVAELKGHTEEVRDVGFSPDGSLVVTASNDNTAIVWEARTGQMRFTLVDPSKPTTADDRMLAAAFSPDGSLIATASYDDAARLWDANTGLLKYTLPHESLVHTAAFSRDGTLLVSASQDGTARVWDVTTGVLSATLSHMSGPYRVMVYGAAFSPDGNRVVTAGHDGNARIWNWTTEEGRVQPRVLSGHMQRDKGIYEASFSPDGGFVVTAGDDSTARIWDARDGSPVAVFRGHESTDKKYIRTARFSPDGRYVVTASTDYTARVWKGVTGSAVFELGGHGGTIEGLSYSPDGKYFVTWGPEKSSYGAAQLWDARTGRHLTNLSGSGVRRVSYSPNGRYLIGVDESDTILTWDAYTGRVVTRENLDGLATAASYSPDGTHVIMGQKGGPASLVNLDTGERKELLGHRGGITGVAFSPDGRLVATASMDNTARVWDVGSGGSVAELKGHSEAVNSVAFSPDGRLVVTASADETARVWDASTGRAVSVLKVHTGPVSGAVFSPDGRYVVTPGHDGITRVWDAASGDNAASLRRHDGRVTSASFSPDGRFIVTAGADHSARVWEWQKEEGRDRPAVLDGHKDTVNAAAFSPDGKSVITVSRDATIRIFPWEEFAPIKDLLEVAALRANRKLTKEEERKYLPK